MNDIPLKFGVPDTLPALSRREIRGCFIFAAMGLFVLLVGLFPALRPPPWMALPLALFALGFAAWGLFRFLTQQRRTVVKTPVERMKGTSTQVSVYVIVMVAAGVGFFVWARHLGVPSPVIFGSLLIIEGLGGVIVSLTEWWRVSHIGVSLGLMVGGFFLPFAGKVSVGVPVGGAVLIGSLLSAAILHWQLRRHEAFPTNRNA
jgi:hypothetical membrane protein